VGDFWATIGSIFWWVFMAYIFIAYLMVMFSIVGDVIRDKDLKGWVKAMWIFLLIWSGPITAIVYLILRGRGMADRQAAQVRESRRMADDYVREVAGTSPADEIVKAKSLLDSGAITADDYAALKAKALA
jgi:hypothetical protein